MELIYQQIKLGITDTTSLETLHMDTDEKNGTAVLTYGLYSERLVAFLRGQKVGWTQEACGFQLAGPCPLAHIDAVLLH